MTAEDSKAPVPATPPAGTGLDGAEVPPCLAPAPGVSSRSAARGCLPGAAPAPGMAACPVPGTPPSPGTGCALERGQDGPHSSEAPARSPRGVARGDTAAASPASPGDAAASQGPVPPMAGGTGGEVEPPPRRLAPSRNAPGGCTPGATAGASPSPIGDAPAPEGLRSPDDLPAAFASRIKINPATGCWEWQGNKDNYGYGRVWWEKKKQRVHRIVYTMLVEPIPAGLVIDHVEARGCVLRSCCRPDHLEAVPSRENTLRGNGITARAARKTHCPQGHPYDEENTLLKPGKGGRNCKKCQRAWRRKNDRRKRSVQLKPELDAIARLAASADGMAFSTWVSRLVKAEIDRRDELELRS